jgi:hypothetical protein
VLSPGLGWLGWPAGPDDSTINKIILIIIRVQQYN